MKTFALLTTALALAVASPAFAQQSNPPAKTSAAEGMSVTAYYKQNVYDQSDNKIGQIADVLIDKDGKITGLVIGAGGFLGMGKHDVIVPFTAVKMAHKTNDSASRTRQAMARNNNDYLVMDTSKDQLKNMPGVAYDRTTMTWTPESSNTNAKTTGQAPKRR